MGSQIEREVPSLPGLKRLLAGAALGAGGALAMAPAAQADDTITVDVDTDVVDGGDGVTSLREAILAANADADADTILFAATVTGSIDLTAGEMAISEPVEIQGPGDADLALDGQTASRIFAIDAEGDPVEISGLTLRNGATTGNYGPHWGGAIKSDNTPLTITDATLSGNSVTGNASNGGAIHSYAGALTITDSTLSGNTTGQGSGGAIESSSPVDITGSTLVFNEALGGSGGAVSVSGDYGYLDVSDSTVSENDTDNSGGAIAGGDATITVDDGSFLADNEAVYGGGAIANVEGGSLNVTDSTLTGNSTSGDGAQGGAILHEDSAAVTITNSTLANNSTIGASADGGAISNSYSGTLTVTDSTLTGNSTAGNGADGGAISNYHYSAVDINGSTISGNSTAGSSANGGGLASTYYGDVTVTDSTISGNSTAGSDADGGGLTLYGDSTTVTNSTISGNSTAGTGTYGGGIYGDHVALTLQSSTVAGNSVTDGRGGGIAAASADPILSNSIVAGNTAGVGPDIGRVAGGAAEEFTADFSLIGNTDGTDFVDGGNNVTGTTGSEADAELGPLQDNGGPTETHAIAETSPALDAGQTAEDADQRGIDRPQRVADDMGSFELTPAGPPTTVDSAPDARSANATPEITFSSVGPDLDFFECRVDSDLEVDFETCVSPFSPPAPLGDGDHTIDVRAVNGSGDRGVAERAGFGIDTTGPATTIDSGPGASTEDHTPTFTFSSGAADLASFECSVDGGAFGTCTGAGTHTTAELGDGPHSFEVRAADDLGTLGAAAKSEFTVTTPEPAPEPEPEPDPDPDPDPDPAPSPDPDPVPDTTAPGLRLSANGNKSSHRRIVADATVNEDAAVELTQIGKKAKVRGLRVGASGKRIRVRLAAAAADLEAGKKESLALAVKGNRTKRKLKRLMRRGKKVVFKLGATATDEVGNTSDGRVRVTLKR